MCNVKVRLCVSFCFLNSIAYTHTFFSQELFLGDVLNSCLVRDTARRKRALIASIAAAAVSTTNDTCHEHDTTASPAAALSSNSHLTMWMFSGKTGEASSLLRMAPLDADELAHPHIPYSRSPFVLGTLRQYGSRSGIYL